MDYALIGPCTRLSANAFGTSPYLPLHPDKPASGVASPLPVVATAWRQSLWTYGREPADYSRISFNTKPVPFARGSNWHRDHRL